MNEVDKLMRLIEEVARLKSINKELLEACRPLADSLLPEKDLNRKDDEGVKCYFKIGDFRKAKRAIEKAVAK